MEHKLKVRVDNLEVELVGTEGFVKEYEAKFSLVEKVRELVNIKGNGNEGNGSKTASGRQTSKKENGQGEKKPFPYVFDLSAEKIKITVNKIPGSNRAEKQVNVALLYLLGMKLKTGNREEIPTKEIREQCEEHGCLDKPNIARYLREKKKLFSISGRRGSSTIRLTNSGEDEARMLAEHLNNEQPE